MAKVHCVILDDDQMPRSKALLTDIRGTDAFMELVKGTYGSKDFAPDQTIKLRVMNAENEAETYSGRIISCEEGRLALAHFALLSQREKRDDVKVIVNKPVYIIRTEEDGAMRKTTATLRDVSAGGVCIISREDIPQGGVFEMVYDLTSAVDVLKVEIIRKQALETGEFMYGCRFADIYFTQEHMVREYVFKRHLGLVGRGRHA